MQAIKGQSCETEPSLQLSLENAFSDSSADISELDGLEIMAKEGEQTTYDNSSTSLRVATPPSSTSTTAEIDPFKGEPVTFTETAQAKRARRSAIEKKSRMRRQNIMTRMREEVKQLENVYADLSRRMDANNSVSLVQRRNFQCSASMDELLQKYSDLTLVAWAMKEDQITLQLLVQEHECFQKHWGGFVKERRAEDAFTIWDSGVPLSSSFAAKFRHITVSDAYRFARKTYDEIQKFTDCEVFETTRSSFMGWTDKRKYDRNSRSLLFSFTKQFEFEDAERLFTMTWDAYLNGHQLEKMLFDSSARTRFEVLQVLNNDLFVARRDYKGQRIPVTLTSVQLMFRLQTATGYAFCLRTISSPEIENALEPHELLFDAYHWMHFNRLYNQFDSPAGCEVVYGGCFDDEDPLRTSHWLFEMVCSIMRWENSAIAPLFLLQS